MPSLSSGMISPQLSGTVAYFIESVSCKVIFQLKKGFPWTSISDPAQPRTNGGTRPASPKTWARQVNPKVLGWLWILHFYNCFANRKNNDLIPELDFHWYSQTCSGTKVHWKEMPPFKKNKKIMVFFLVQLFHKGQLLPFFQACFTQSDLGRFLPQLCGFLIIKTLGFLVSLQFCILKQPSADDDWILNQNKTVQETGQKSRCLRSPWCHVFDFCLDFRDICTT